MTQFKLKLGPRTEFDLRNILYFEQLDAEDYARLTPNWQQAGAMPQDYKTRIVFVNREPTFTRMDLDEIRLRAPRLVEVQPGRLVPIAAVRLIRPVDDEQRAQMAAAYPDQAEAIGRKQTRFEYALPDADGDPVVKHYPLSIEGLRDLEAQPVNIGGERFVFAANITGAEKLDKETLSKLRQSYSLADKQGVQVQTIHGPLIGTVPVHSIRQRAGLKVANEGQEQEASAATDDPDLKVG
jgi:hypothetical protein